jgi:hypothetical protein
VLILTDSIDQHWKYLEKNIVQIIKQNCLVVSTTKIKLFHDKVKFLGHNIYQGSTNRLFQFADKFSVEIKHKNHLQICIGSRAHCRVGK